MSINRIVVSKNSNGMPIEVYTVLRDRDYKNVGIIQSEYTMDENGEWVLSGWNVYLDGEIHSWHPVVGNRFKRCFTQAKNWAKNNMNCV